MWRARKIPAKELGRMGERRARWFYRLRGYSILGTNVRFQNGELDLVVRRGGTLVVVEVKTRQSLVAGEGFDSVDARKRAQLVRLAEAYIARLPKPPKQLRYDIVSLYWTGRRFIITHIADAFRVMSDPRQPWKWRV